MSPPRTRLDQFVDAVINDLGAKHKIKERTEALKMLGPIAVPRVVAHLEAGPRNVQTLAFYALQYCWHPAALDAVVPYLADDDAEMRRMASIVIVKGEGFERLARCCRPLIDDERHDVAAFALDHVEPEEPSLKRTHYLMEVPHMWPVLSRHISRYHDPHLTRATRGMIERTAADPGHRSWTGVEADEVDPVAGGIAALAYQTADDAESRALVVRQLGSADPFVRELAGEYLAWHGDARELEALDVALACESDAIAAASLAAARPLMAERAARPEVAPIEPIETHNQLTTALAEAEGDRARAWQIYRHGLPMEPRLAFRGDKASGLFIRARRAWAGLRGRLIGIPGDISASREDRDGKPAAVARGAVAPVRGFFDEAKTNYGIEVATSAVAGFQGLMHVGVDKAWSQPGAAVLAVADGIVRYIGCVETWGYLVIVEHAEADGSSYCSLYGHLAPMIFVTVGETVAAGRKIGSVGRPYSWENGGYKAHLHFGIHTGAYISPWQLGDIIDLNFEGARYRGLVMASDADQTLVRILTWRGYREVALATQWSAGYISKPWFEAGDHGWQDPTSFLEARGAS